MNRNKILIVFIAAAAITLAVSCERSENELAVPPEAASRKASQKLTDA
ncbi:MAG: hypothetical protein LBS01_01795 [Prevotellaceae bacterium]|jgi:hypothetical protein|nr:hypothetical protein [Prevotellaceae bacterium]